MNSDTANSSPILSDSVPTLTGEVFDALPQSVRAYIRYLETVIQQQQTHILQLQTRVSDLEARLAKDSSNSGKPPSSDGLKRKPKSQRVKSEKKPGGQQGRDGKGLPQVENPDLIRYPYFLQVVMAADQT